MATRLGDLTAPRIDLRRVGSFVDDFLVNLLFISIIALILLVLVEQLEGLGGFLILIALGVALLTAAVQNWYRPGDNA